MYRSLIGTAKGLIVVEFNGDVPTFSDVYFRGFAVTMVYVDPRTSRWWAGVSHKHWGQKLHFSDDQGHHWHETALPAFQGETMPNGQKAILKQIWCMSHGGSSHPDRLWLGTEPGALFLSDNGGASFELCRPLWDHPSRSKEGQWFGAGSDRPFLHSIEVDPHHDDHVYVGVSSAGVFKTTDGGATWEARNQGLVATYLPNPHVEVGHDPHRLLISPTNPEIIWQQNHCGIFLSKDRGVSWIDVSAKEGLPSYGFALAIEDQDPAKAWVIPVASDEQRIAPDLRLRVFKTEDYGQTWQSDSEGLPQDLCFDIVLRHSFAKLDQFFLFGTTNGNLYYRIGLAPWQLLHSSLTKVNCITLY